MAVTVFDVLVVGGGLSGLTAGLFAARHGHSTHVLVADLPGGLITNIERVDDFPGWTTGVSGFELGPALQEQAANAGAGFQMAEATGLHWHEDHWVVDTSEDPLEARTVIWAGGAKPRRLGVPGEERLTGRGVSHCASCDGPLLRGKAAVVVGAGDSGLQEALTLAQFASDVLVVERSDTPTAQRAYRDAVATAPNVRLLTRHRVDEVLGSDTVTGVRLRNLAADTTEDVACDAVFVYMGLEPATQALAGLLPLAPTGHVPTDIRLATALPGLFASGAVRADFSGQAVSAAGDGATAAVSAHGYLLRMDGRQG